MAKGKRCKKKENDLRINIEITTILILSILLGTLIYMKSGYAGMRLSVILGGLISWIKYIIPVGIFIIGMYNSILKIRRNNICTRYGFRNLSRI